MALRIGENRITSDEVAAVAQRYENTQEGARYGVPAFYWTVTGWDDRSFDRNQAISAMTLAEERGRPEPNAALVDSLEDELRELAEVPEQHKADTLKVLAAEAASRTEALQAVDGWTRRVRTAALSALDAGVSIRRAAQVGGVSPDTVMRWSKEAKAAAGTVGANDEEGRV